MKIILVLLYICDYAYSITPEVKVEQGTLSGKEHTTSNGKVLNAFLGVPYAAPPIGDNRFKEPQELKRWEGVWDASSQRYKCLQTKTLSNSDPESIIGNEDCLYMNIYTPKLPADGKNPNLNVMVFIHGGAFMIGSGNDLLPDYISEMEDIVFIAINYRLGVFGFLSTNDAECPGNFGLKDQAAALKWVKNNIIHFGGNPGSVTIVGISAGAASVHFHMISSTTENLFQKAISFSGTALNPWVIAKKPFEKAIKIASLAACPSTATNSENIVKCLRQKSAQEIIQTLNGFSSLEWESPLSSIVGPVIEQKNSNAFLTEDPIEILRRGDVKDIPWLVSMVKDEGLFPALIYITSDKILESFEKDWNTLAPIILSYKDIKSENRKDDISSNIRQFYFKDKPISKETANQFVELVSDRLFLNGIIDGAITHNFVIESNVYLQKFSYRGEKSSTNLLTGKDSVNYGVSHTDDLQYFIKQPTRGQLNTESDKAMSKLLISIITNFMFSGNPNKVVPHWEPIVKRSNSDIKFLNINSATDLKMDQIPEESPKRKFWRNVFTAPKAKPTTEKHKEPNSSCVHFIGIHLVPLAVFTSILRIYI